MPYFRPARRELSDAGLSQDLDGQGTFTTTRVLLSFQNGD